MCSSYFSAAGGFVGFDILLGPLLFIVTCDRCLFFCRLFCSPARLLPRPPPICLICRCLTCLALTLRPFLSHAMLGSVQCRLPMTDVARFAGPPSQAILSPLARSVFEYHDFSSSSVACKWRYNCSRGLRRQEFVMDLPASPCSSLKPSASAPPSCRPAPANQSDHRPALMRVSELTIAHP